MNVLPTLNFRGRINLLVWSRRMMWLLPVLALSTRRASLVVVAVVFSLFLAGALKAWEGKPENVEAAQRAYYHRAKMNAAARTGMYAPEMETAATA